MNRTRSKNQGFKLQVNGMKALGFTLIELAVVLAVIAVLAAVLTPLVTSYIDQARETRTRADVLSVTQAIILYNRDTGKFPIFQSAGATTAQFDVLHGPGQPATLPSASMTAAGWPADAAKYGDFEPFLNTNKLGLPSTAPGGSVAYRGPYLSTINADAWGSRYVITAKFLEPSSTNIAFVISKGPNGAIETAYQQPRTGTLTAGGDDIVARIR